MLNVVCLLCCMHQPRPTKFGNGEGQLWEGVGKGDNFKTWDGIVDKVWVHGEVLGAGAEEAGPSEALPNLYLVNWHQ